MKHDLKNPDYDFEFLVEQIAKESPTFKSYIQSALLDTDSEFPTNEIWLGTLKSGKDNSKTQIKLTVTQEHKHFIDEND